ncbi:MAG: hypothetical protein J0L61_04885 [Planctomycetes bacterium]|nr:hypothetical protein [Planctomycetota bacterium]
MITASFSLPRAAAVLVTAITSVVVVSCRSSAPAPSARSAATERMDRYYLPECAVCAGALGAKGEAVARLYDGRELRFCDEACARAFDANRPAGFGAVDARIVADQAALYPLRTCIVSDRPLPARPVDVVWGNRLFRVAGEPEKARLLADPGAYTRRLDDAVRAAQTPGYPMARKCPVQGDILEGDPVIDIVVANRMIRVCCGRCARVVRASPYQYLSMVDYARGAASSAAGTERTPDSGDRSNPQ